MLIYRFEAIQTTYRCSKEANEILTLITRLAGFSYDNVVSRLALGRSLSEKKSICDDELGKLTNRNGKEIKGQNFFSREMTIMFVSMVIQHLGRPVDSIDELRELIESHWERGLRLIQLDLKKNNDNIDSLLNEYAEKSCLSKGDFEEVSGELLDIFDKKIIGQEEAKTQIKRLLREALEKNPTCLPENILFIGTASTGKTLFSKTIAEILSLPYIESTGTSLKSVEQLFEQIDKELESEGLTFNDLGIKEGLQYRKYPPLVIFIDECHQLKRPIQDALLTMTEPSEKIAHLRTFIADMTDVTFLFATTDIGLIEKALKTRFREIQLRTYSLEEIAQIIGLDYPSWTPECRKLIALAGRLVPRVAKERAKDFERILKQDFQGQKPNETTVLEIMKKEWGQDRLGMQKRDIDYLRILQTSHGPVGADNIAQQLEISVTEVENDIEPYLIRMNFIQRSKTGRELTPQGKSLLNNGNIKN